MALAHELEHIRAGHDGCQPRGIEGQVRNRAARFLLPDPHPIAEALVSAAEELWVDEDTLRARLDIRHLHPAERAIIVNQINALEGGC